METLKEKIMNLWTKKNKTIGDILKGNKRLKHESFSKYKIRRLTENLLLKRYLRGFTFHQGKTIYRLDLAGKPQNMIVQGQGPARRYNYGR